MASLTSKKRKGNWCESSVAALVDIVINSIVIIEGRLTMSLTAAMKSAKWVTITECVNAQSSEVRTGEEVKKKWADLKSNAKKKERLRRQYMTGTGGGPAGKFCLTEIEDKIIRALSETAIVGICGGVDIFDSHSAGEVNVAEAEGQLVEEMPDLDESNETVPSPVIASTSNEDQSQTDSVSISEGNRQSKKRKRSSECECHKEILSIEKQRLQIEQEKLLLKKEKNNILNCQLVQMKNANDLLQSIAANISCSSESYLQVSPVIKFPEF